jgi:hypothetical protein
MTKKTQKLAKQAKPPKRSRAAKPANQVAPAKKMKPTKPAGNAYVLFGADEYAKPRAARFSAEDPDLLAKAAEAMHLRLVKVTDPDVAEIAATLPAGRLHANGKSLVPYVKGDMYIELGGAIMGDEAPQAHPDPTARDLPGTWDEVASGHVVLARETLECGWWEAVVTERTGDLVTVRYRDYPHYPPMVRHRSAIALISAPAP